MSSPLSYAALSQNLITRTRLTLRPCVHEDKDYTIWHTSAKGLVYLYGIFTLTQGAYVGHTVEQIIALDVVSTADEPTDAQAQAMAHWTVVGEHLVGRLLESAGRADKVERYRRYLAQHRDREFDYKQLESWVCVIKLGHG